MQVKKSSKKTAKRTTSNIFGMFSQNQLSEFKQAFQFIDFDKDGIINRNDIVAAFDSLGRRYPDDEISSMISEAGGPVNYTTFIRLIGEKIYSGKTMFVIKPPQLEAACSTLINFCLSADLGDEEDDDLQSALSKFDLNNTGKINRETFFKSLCTFGEKLTQDEVNSMMEFIYVDKNDNIDVDHLLKTLNGSLEDDA